MIGKILVLTEDLNIIGIDFKKNDQFKIIGEEGMRGLNIEHIKTGEKIYETAMISDKFIDLALWRDEKLNDIL